MGIGYRAASVAGWVWCDGYYVREVYSGLARGLGSYCWVGVMKGDFAIVLGRLGLRQNKNTPANESPRRAFHRLTVTRYNPKYSWGE